MGQKNLHLRAKLDPVSVYKRLHHRVFARNHFPCIRRLEQEVRDALRTLQ